MRNYRKRPNSRGLWQTVALLAALLLSALPSNYAGAQGAQPAARAPFAPKQLIFISDGMRPDIVDRYVGTGDMPNYARIVGEGVTGENGMVPAIAANTGTGWTTLSTGAWPGVHGQVNNTYHVNSAGILTSTSGFDASRTQAEPYWETLEKNGKKVAVMEWAGALPAPRVKGPVVDFRNFYSNRGVVTNYPLPNIRPDPFVNYTNTLQIADATGWTGAPQSFSPAKETSFSFRTNPISNTVVTMTFPVYIYDTTNDNAANYDKVFIAKGSKDAAQVAADLKVGEWKDVKTNLPQNNLLVGMYVKLIDLSPDLSKVRIYFTSLQRVRANLPDLEQKIAADFPTVIAADFAPLQGGYVDALTYVEQGLKFYDSFKQIHQHVITTYTPDVVFAGYPVTDEFSHQFLALATPSYTGPRLVNVDQATAEGYIKMAYKQADQILGDLMGQLGPNTNTFVGADHGFAPTWKSVNVNQVLQDAGLVNTITRTNSSALAYIAGGFANVYINLKGREAGGVVEANQYEAVRTQIVDAFNNLSDGGTKVAAKVFKKEEMRAVTADGATINAWHPTRTGDVVVILKPPYQFDAPTTGQIIADAPFYGQHGFMPDLVDLPNNINMHAMFGMHGPNVARGKKIPSPAFVDLVPTAAYAMNVPVPRWSTGRVLTEAFADNSASLVPIQVLAWGDYHGQLDPVTASIDSLSIPSGGVANIGAYWKEAKAKNPNGTIILSDGDNVGATPPNSAFLNDEPTILAMNELGFTASAMGNHEFDKGVAGLEKVRQLAKFPYLANNIMNAQTGQLASFATPYIITKANGIDVGIIGIGNPETATVVSPRLIAGYNWIDPVAPTNKYVQELVAKGVRTIIVVYHQGSVSGDFDTVNGIFGDHIRKFDPEIDLVVGGHTRVKTMTRVNGILVSAANQALETSEITLMVDPQTKNVAWSWGAFRRPLGGAITPDPALAKLTTDANNAIKPTLGEEVGTAAALVDRSRGAESKMGNLVSDAIRATYGVDVALQNSGGLRADFQPGPINKGGVFAVLPFGNLVVTGKLKGADLLLALENGVSDVSGSAGRFIQLSGLRFAFDASKPVGQRVLWAVLSDGKAVDPAATYNVATNDFMQVGGDGYTALTRMTEVTSREQLWEVAANYVKSLGTVDPQVGGRINAVQAGQPAPAPPVEVTPTLPTPASILPTAVPVAATSTSVPTPTTPAAAPTTQPAPTTAPIAPNPTSVGGNVPGMPRTGDGGGEFLIATAALGALMLLMVGLLALRRKPAR